MSTRFAINANWPGREEDPPQIGEHLLRTLDALSAIDPVLQSWWYADMERMDFAPFAELRSNIAEAVESFVVDDDYGDPEPSSGYRIHLYSYPKDTPRTFDLWTHAGNKNKGITANSIHFGPKIDVTPEPAFSTFPFVRAVMMTIVSIWNPTVAHAFVSDDDDDKPHNGGREKSDRLFTPQWMTYLSAPMAAEVTPPDGVTWERTADGGLLLIAAEETYDRTNPKHVAAATAIADALAGFSYRKAMAWPPR